MGSRRLGGIVTRCYGRPSQFGLGGDCTGKASFQQEPLRHTSDTVRVLPATDRGAAEYAYRKLQVAACDVAGDTLRLVDDKGRGPSSDTWQSARGDCAAVGVAATNPLQHGTSGEQRSFLAETCSRRGARRVGLKPTHSASAWLVNPMLLRATKHGLQAPSA
ncbi:hypothetical protein LX36DRAFT_674893 [Colletotrichum falcatum]|nr:hypothetical protein LX36DRAFT_674893 [Colletotrichum falcatum]